MTPIQSLILVLIIFCRLSGFLMIAPGFSGDRIPVLLRLYLSLAISVFAAPIIETEAFFNPSNLDYSSISLIVLHELILGVFFGFLCRIFIFALETIVTCFCYTIGLSNIFDAGVVNTETSPVLSSFFVIATIQLIFITELHLVFIQGIVNSYKIIPVDQDFSSSIILNNLTNSISQSYLLVIQILSPILLFSIIVNLAFAFLARLSPNIPVFFVSGPCVILLGFFFFNSHSRDFFTALIFSFRHIILRS